MARTTGYIWWDDRARMPFWSVWSPRIWRTIRSTNTQGRGVALIEVAAEMVTSAL
jgi:hypothetical protein